MQLPWFIPQLQVVSYFSEDNLSQEGVTDLSKSELVITAYRDEANRPWWNVFDEYEYRDTTAEAKRHRNWHWYREGTPAAAKRHLFKLDLCLALYI